MDLIVMVEQAVGEGINSRYRCSRLADCRRHILRLRRPGDARLGCLLVVPGTGCPPVTQVVRLKLFFCYR
ncbi:hypothetical protein KQQSB11_380447 [Klebsiella quasipneumoniae subsp. quasipneumoniae]|nr:hypothetical protein KQQSB11_380447 [Klebsiella quasipneumoniae subsp. quasipneumoniae]